LKRAAAQLSKLEDTPARFPYMKDLPLTLRVLRVQQQGREIRSFDMLPAGAAGRHGVEFVPGQVAVLRAGDEQAYFAFASAPEDEELEFLVKRGGGAGGTIYEMQEGDRVELVSIIGHGFRLREQKGKDLVFVAMGTGVAPLRSALRCAISHAGEFGQMVVLYGARTPEDFCYGDEVEEWEARGVELRRVISRPDGHDWSGPTGYVQSLLDHVLPDLASPVALICGSREMIGQTRERLQQMGFAPDEILTNY
jgi:sulfhydrogenase subunit gamma (sulfur reductase)